MMFSKKQRKVLNAAFTVVAVLIILSMVLMYSGLSY